MKLYNLLCNACRYPFQRYAWGGLEDHERLCPNCQSRDVSLRWIVDEPFEAIAGFGCGCGAGS